MNILGNNIRNVCIVGGGSASHYDSQLDRAFKFTPGGGQAIRFVAGKSDRIRLAS